MTGSATFAVRQARRFLFMMAVAALFAVCQVSLAFAQSIDVTTAEELKTAVETTVQTGESGTIVLKNDIDLGNEVVHVVGKNITVLSDASAARGYTITMSGKKACFFVEDAATLTLGKQDGSSKVALKGSVIDKQTPENNHVNALIMVRNVYYSPSEGSTVNIYDGVKLSDNYTFSKETDNDIDHVSENDVLTYAGGIDAVGAGIKINIYGGEFADLYNRPRRRPFPSFR